MQTMQTESDHLQDSSNNNYHQQIKQTYSIRNRRKIYDDNDFKEVVKNFYNLVSEINKAKKIGKPQVKKQQMQNNRKNPTQKQSYSKEPALQKRDFNLKSDMQQAQQFFNQTFSQQLMSSINPHFNNQTTNMLFSENNKIQFHFRRNQYHVQIAYQTYIKIYGPKLVESQDPTSVARKVMNNSFNNKPQFPEEEKQGDVSEQLSKNLEEGKKKPLKDLVKELESDQ